MAVTVVEVHGERGIVVLASPAPVLHPPPVLPQGIDGAVQPGTGAEEGPLPVEELNAAKPRLAVAASKFVVELVLSIVMHNVSIICVMFIH